MTLFELYHGDALQRELAGFEAPPDTPDPFVKHDRGKARLDLVPPLALLAVGRVLAHGAAKYGAGNWRKCPPDEARGRYVAAAMRHLLALLAGEDVDPKTGESHAAHAACCALFLAELRGGGA